MKNPPTPDSFPPPVDNDHVAPGCEQFGAPTKTPEDIVAQPLPDMGNEELSRRLESLTASNNALAEALRGVVSAGQHIDLSQGLTVAAIFADQFNAARTALATAEAQITKWQNKADENATWLRQTEEKLTLLRTQVAELTLDKTRLDWLEANGHNIHIGCWKGEGAMTNPWTIHIGDFDGTAAGEASTLRETIDAARAASGQKKG